MKGWQNFLMPRKGVRSEDYLSQNIVAKIFVCMYVQACWPMLQTDVQGVGVCPLKSHIILTPYPWQTKDSCMAMQE